MTKLIYFIEPEKSFADEVSKTFSEAGYSIEIFSDLNDLTSQSTEKTPEIIFFQQKAIPANIDSHQMIRDQYSVIYGDKIDVDEKLKYYGLGFSRVLDKNFSEPILLLHFLNLYLYNKYELQPLISSRVTQGNLREFKLVDILYNSIFVKRNLIIKIEEDHWFAKIRTFQGQIIEAVCPGKEGIEAVLEILRHQNGRLRLQSYDKSNEVSQAICSTFALVNETKYEEQAFHNFQLKIGNKNPIFRKKSRFKNKFLPYEQEEIFKLVNGYDGLHTILRKSPFGLLTTIRSLEDLLQMKAISYDKKKAKSNQFTSEDLELMRERLLAPGNNNGVVLILGGKDSGKADFMKTLAEQSGLDLEIVENVESLILPLEEEATLQVIGIPIDADFGDFIRENSDYISSSILMVNYKNKENFEYLKYFLKQFLANYNISLVIGLTNLEDTSEETFELAHRELEVPLQIEMISIKPDDFWHIRRIFYQMMDLPLKEIKD